MDSRYTDKQYAENYPDGIDQHYWNVARNAVILDTVAERGNGLVLDVGCGRGVVVDYLRGRGIDCWGCEVGTPRPLTSAVAPFLMLGTDALAVSDALANDVTHLLFLDVLEHLEHPESLLAGCRRRYPNARRMTITLPARRELWTNYDDWFGHYRRYDVGGARELIASLSPRALDIGYFFHLLYPAILIKAKLGSARATAAAAPTTPLTRRIHRLLGDAIRMSDRVFPSWLPGSSIRVVVDL